MKAKPSLGTRYFENEDEAYELEAKLVTKETVYSEYFYGTLQGVAYSANTVPFTGIPTGTTSETVAVGNHEHEIYATKTELNGIENRVSVLETEHNTLVLEEDKKFSPIDETFNLVPNIGLINTQPYFILQNGGSYYSIKTLNTWGNFGIEEGSLGNFLTYIECKPTIVENDEDGNDVILVEVVSAYTEYVNSSGVTQKRPWGVLSIKGRTVDINGVTYYPNCILEKDDTFKITVPHDVTLNMEEFRKETITIGTESNLGSFIPEKIWKEVDYWGVVSIYEFTLPKFNIGGYSNTDSFNSKYNLKLDSLPNTDISNEYGVVVDKIKYHHDLNLPESPKIGKKIEIINNSLYGQKILAKGKDINYSFNGSLQKISGDNGVENTNKVVTCISAGH